MKVQDSMKGFDGLCGVLKDDGNPIFLVLLAVSVNAQHNFQ